MVAPILPLDCLAQQGGAAGCSAMLADCGDCAPVVTASCESCHNLTFLLAVTSYTAGRSPIDNGRRGCFAS